MTNGNMKEAQEGKAVLEDLDPEAFTYVSEFAYTGDCDIKKLAMWSFKRKDCILS